MSRRFGSDKARAVAEGEPLIARVAAALKPIAQSVTVVADVPGKYDDLGLTTITDLEPKLGPIGGLLTALEHRADAGGGWVMVCSCDLVHVTPAWFEYLWKQRGDKAQAVVMDDGELQTLAALYHSDFRGHVQRQIEGGRLALWSMISEARGFAETVAVPAGLHVKQANRREDLV